MNISLVTSIFGGIDIEKKIPVQTIPFTHYHFNEKTSPFPFTNLCDRMKARYFKTQMHLVLNADYFIWIDGKIEILRSDFIEQMLNQLGGNEFGIMKHMERKCIYQEVDHIEKCLKHGNKYMLARYGNNHLRQEVEYYRSRGYPAGNGLNDCCIFIRKSSSVMNCLFNDWWDKAITMSNYDQAAVQFTAWEHGVKIVPLIFKPGTFKDVPHILVK